MSIFSILIIAIGLAMDAFAVSICTGIKLKKLKPTKALKVGLYFGGFQAIMPLIGWAISTNFKSSIENIDHWIAFILLSIIGGKMLLDAIKDEKEQSSEEAMAQETSANETNSEDCCGACKSIYADNNNPIANKTLLVLAVATSIDALVVGISFAILDVNIIQAVSIIGIVTLIISFIGVMLGKKLGELFKQKAEILGGVILIGMGIKILVEHLFF